MTREEYYRRDRASTRVVALHGPNASRAAATRASLDASDGVIARLDIYRELRALHARLRSEPQRHFLAALARRPDLWNSLGEQGEWKAVAAEVGLNSDYARQLGCRIRKLVESRNATDAA